MTKLEQLQSILKKHHLWAKKSLGQNFLVDENALEAIVEAAQLQPSDNVIEVGPGTGFLTEQLIEKVAQVLAIELDEDMVKVLNDRFSGVGNLEIVQEDALKVQIAGLPFLQTPSGSPKGGGVLQPSSLSSYKLVANIPYYITSPLIKHFLHSGHPPELMVILMQKEVAEKICGKGGKTLLSVQVEVFGEPEVVAQVPRTSFYPSPKVDSAVLRIRPHSEPLVAADQQKAFFRLVKFGYSQKRKKLSNTLAAGLQLKSSEVVEKMKSVGIDPNLRAEHLGVGEWRRLIRLFG